MFSLKNVGHVVFVYQLSRRSQTAALLMPPGTWELQEIPEAEVRQRLRGFDGPSIKGTPDCDHKPLIEQLVAADFKVASGTRELTTRRRDDNGLEEIDRFRFDLVRSAKAVDINNSDAARLLSILLGFAETAGWLTALYEPSDNGQVGKHIFVNAIGPEYNLELVPGTNVVQPKMVWPGSKKTAQKQGKSKVHRKPANVIDVVDDQITVILS